MSYCFLEEKKGYIAHAEEKVAQTEWPKKWDKPILTFQVLQGTKDVPIGNKLRKAVGIAFTTWGLEIPLKFAHVKRGETPDITIRFENDPEADHIFKSRPTVLAYAYYPKTGKKGIVVFNDFRYMWGTKDEYVGGKHVYNVIQVLIHELGHTLGLAHDTQGTSADVMDPYYDGLMTDLSPNDIIRIRKKYGVRMFKRWNLYQRMKNFISKRKKKFR